MSDKSSFDFMAALFPYVATTRDITIRVAVSYLAEQSDPDAGRWFWSYHIRIENKGGARVQLLTRQWRIADGKGTIHEVRGEGVIGQTPTIPPGDSYDYVSGCPLSTPTGSMIGSYRFMDEQGATFEAAIPAFPLVAPATSQSGAGIRPD